MNNPILELSFDFAVELIGFCDTLQLQKKFVISNQLLRSGTSIGANVREAQNPHSRADFIAKMIIAVKEADETEYWLELCKKCYKCDDADILLQKNKVLIKLLSKIISSSKKNF